MQSIRDRATGWIAWIIVILISIPFALWGIQEYLSPTSNVAVAVVNGTEIGINDFQRRYQRQLQQLRAFLGPSFDLDQLNEEQLRSEALQELINSEIMLQAALDGGMRIGDAQLARAIQVQETFQRDGRFSEELYQQWLRNQGYSAGGFEIDLKRSMLAEQLVAGIASSAIVTDRELENAVRLQRQERVIDTLTVPVTRFDDAEVDAQAIQAHYEANQVDYVSPEQVKLKYVGVSRDAIAAGIDVDEATLREVYERRKADLRTPEQREASHILVALADDADEAAVAAARERLEALKKEIDAGASFEDLARQHSEDPGSAPQGGSLGSFGRGVMDPSFEDAAFRLAAGEVSDPVRSAFGYHLIRVDAIHEARLPSFEEIRESLDGDYRNSKAEQEFVELVEIMTTVAFEHPDSIDAVADTLGLDASVSDWVSPTPAANSGIGRDPKVVEAAFSEEVLQEGYNSEPIELDPTHVVVFRVAEHRPSKQQPLEEVRDRIEQMLKAREARKLAAASGRELLERLRAGEERTRVAEQADLEWSGATPVGRDATSMSPSVLQTAFRLRRPDADGPSFDGTATVAGDYVIVALEKVVDGSLEGGDEAQRLEVRRQLEVEAGREAYDAVVKTLRSRADVTIIEENL